VHAAAFLRSSIILKNLFQVDFVRPPGSIFESYNRKPVENVSPVHEPFKRSSSHLQQQQQQLSFKQQELSFKEQEQHQQQQHQPPFKQQQQLLPFKQQPQNHATSYASQNIEYLAHKNVEHQFSQ
jgi:hypothetical protein